MPTLSPQAIHEQLRSEKRGMLLEHEAYALLAEADIEVPRHVFVERDGRVDAAALAALGSAELVLKIVSPDVLHKSDVGGVKMVPNDAVQVGAAMRVMIETVGAAMPTAELRGVLIAEKVDFAANLTGTEYLISARRDAAFGPVLMFGLGGLLSEWYGELAAGDAHMIFSAQDFDAQSMLTSLQNTAVGKMALAPSRLHREAPLRREALSAGLRGLARLINASDSEGAPLWNEIELNPVIAKDGGLLALDALVRVEGPQPTARLPRPVERVGNLLHPRSAVVLGASTKAMNAGRIILQNLKQSEGIEYGRLYAIHPTADRIDGVPCYPSVQALPEGVDLAVVSIPAKLAPKAIDELVEQRKTRSIILIPGGFAETGHGELTVEIQASLARGRVQEDGGAVLVGGNCLGIVSKREYNTFFLPTYKLPFHRAPGTRLVAVSQSGAYLVTFTSNMDGIIFPRASISYGNEMDLTASDFLEYYLEHESDPAVFCFYIEGFKPFEGERFLRLIRRARQMGKAVVVYKAGHTEGGAKAAASHTASIAGDYVVAAALLREAGALLCETLNMFEDFTRILTMLKDARAQGNRVAVITNAGFEAGAVSDHLYGLELANFSDETRAKLAAVLPEIAHTGNPIDATPMTDTKAFIEAVEIMAAAPEVDAMIVSAVPATATLDILAPDLSGEHRENIYAMESLPAELVRVFNTTNKPMVVAIDSGRLYDASVLLLQRARIPVYRKIDRASRALSAFVEHGQAARADTE